MGKAVVPKPYYTSELPGNSSMQIPSVPFSKTIKLSRGGARNLEFNRFPMPLTCGVVFGTTGVGKRVLAVPCNVYSTHQKGDKLHQAPGPTLPRSPPVVGASRKKVKE